MKKILLLLPVTLFLFPARLDSQTSRFWRQDERILLTDFSVVRAVAASRTYLFVAADLGLLVYDYVFGRWKASFSYLDGYPAREVSVALADPSDESVWLGTRRGLFHYRPNTDIVDSIPVFGGVSGLMLDADAPFSGLFVRTGSGWEVLPRGGLSTQRVSRLPERRLVPVTVTEALNRYPELDASRAALLVDARLRQAAYTSAAFFPGSDKVAMGTHGMGTIIVDPLVARYDVLQYGIVGPGAGAIVFSDGDLWVGSYGRSPRVGFTRLTADLNEMEFKEGPRAVGFNFQVVRDLEVDGETIYAATDNGLLVAAPDRNPRIINTDLPGRDAYSVLMVDSGIWVGTDRGLAFVDKDLNVSIGAGSEGRAVYDMARVGDTIWLATDAGLGMIEPTLNRVGVPNGVLSNMDLTGPVTAVATLSDTLAVLTADRRIVWRAGGEDTWHTVLGVNQLGPVFTMAADDGGVWLGGQNGFGFVRLADGASRFFNAPRDLPAPARDIAISDDHIWVATEGGVVRFSKRAVQ